MLDLIIILCGAVMLVLGCGWLAENKPRYGFACFLYGLLMWAAEIGIVAFRWWLG